MFNKEAEYGCVQSGAAIKTRGSFSLTAVGKIECFIPSYQGWFKFNCVPNDVLESIFLVL